QSSCVPLLPGPDCDVEFGRYCRRTGAGHHMAVDQVNLTSGSGIAVSRMFEFPGDPPASTELGRLAELLGTAVTGVGLGSGRIVDTTDESLLPVAPPELMWHCVQTGTSRVLTLTSGLVCFALPFPGTDSAAHVAVGYVLSKPGLRPADLVFAAAERGWSQPELDAWLSRLPHCDPEMLRRHV